MLDLSAARDRINANRYKFTRLKSVYKLKPNSPSPREVLIPTVRDRVVLKALAVYLTNKGLPKGPGLPTSVTSRVYRKVHGDEPRLYAFARTDIRNFFPSLSHQKLIAALKAVDLDHRAKHLISSALELSVTQGTGVPQGIPIATCLTEFYLRSLLVPLFSGFRSIGSFAYRYVDDFLILSPSEKDASKCMTELSLLLEASGLHVHPISRSIDSKSTVGRISEGFGFLGYNFDFSGASVPRDKLTSILDRIASTVHTYRREISDPKLAPYAASRANWYMRVAMNGCIWRGRRRGWLPYYLGTNDLDSFALVTNRAKRIVEKFGFQDVLTVPSMVDAYFSFRRNRADRILNLDALSTDERVEWLTTVSLISRSKALSWSEEEVDSVFNEQIGSRLGSLETDLSLYVY